MRAAVYNWPSPDQFAVCETQTTAAAGSLSLNGNLVVYPPNTSTGGLAEFPGISRTVSITSAANLSGIDFTISGFYRGSAVSEEIAGPNASTVYTTVLFDTVSDVSANAAVASAVSVGSGTTGATHPWLYNYNVNTSLLTISVEVSGTINYTLRGTMDDLNKTANPVLFNPIATMVGATTNQIGNPTPVPFQYAFVQINSSTTGSLVARFLQTGFR